MKNTDRSAALTILLQLFERHTPLTYLLQSSDLSPLTKALCFGVARHYDRMTRIALSLVDKRPKDLTVWLCLMLGIYQIEYLSIPDYAVVQETVALLQQTKKSWAKGFINALLRRFCRDREAIKTALACDIVFTYDHPLWLIQKVTSDWPDDWASILTANNQHPPMTLRVNPLHQTRDAYSQRLKTLGLDNTCVITSGIILKAPCHVNDIPGFSSGEVSVQDAAAQLAGPLLELSPGLNVLDACCAPGGKLGHILELEPDLSLCLGLDIDSNRLEKVQENCKRLDLHPQLKTGDAALPETWWDGVYFDRILLDAPCSATGIIRRHPDIKHLRTLNEIKQAAERQTLLLEALWPLLAPKGILVYATCSIMPEENEDQIKTFLERHPDAAINTDPQPWGRQTGYGWQIFPNEQSMDGFFYAKIQRI